MKKQQASNFITIETTKISRFLYLNLFQSLYTTMIISKEQEPMDSSVPSVFKEYVKKPSNGNRNKTMGGQSFLAEERKSHRKRIRNEVEDKKESTLHYQQQFFPCRNLSKTMKPSPLDSPSFKFGKKKKNPK
ncbi:hypothetical protein ACTA71_000838 [Dictyostelium dimigraforme]